MIHGAGYTLRSNASYAGETSVKRRRSWKWWLANLMIAAGVLLLAYPLGTWGYTWFEQRALRKQLERANPQITALVATPTGRDFIPVQVTTDTTLQALASPAAVAEAEAAATAAAIAEAERQAQLAAFRTAADAFERSVTGKTGEPIGEIIIRSIGMDVVMVEGTGTGDLRQGPGHWPETPFPGQGGNFVVSGHRTTYGAPFLKLNKVKVGDEIDLVLPYGLARYTVTRVVIVLPTQVEEVAQRGKEQVSLAACHPIYSAKQRIVVQGDLISFKLIGPQS
jgi:LPXTG-site transpeptidase (sortase) family protein